MGEYTSRNAPTADQFWLLSLLNLISAVGDED